MDEQEARRLSCSGMLRSQGAVMVFRISSIAGMEEAESKPPNRLPFGFFERIEGREWIGTASDEKPSPPTLAPLKDYLARGGRITKRLRLWLIASLEENGDSECAIKIQRRTRGRPKKDPSKDWEIGYYIFRKIEGSITKTGAFEPGVPVESAIKYAMDLFGISRQTAFSAKKLVEVGSQEAASVPYDPVLHGDTDEEE
ncbi:MAG: hypothetical protein OEL76_12250 [Siculibacillus sp.]|nr:hypothetical protein [Siculibacillus sp.]